MRGIKLVKFLLWAFLLVSPAVAWGLYSYLSIYTQARQARFTVDVLDRLVRAYILVENRTIGNLSGLPDFHIISARDSLSVKGEDLRRGISRGYKYDMTSTGQGRYVISASPINDFQLSVEFGITEDGKLRANNKNVDFEADSYEEVKSWQQIVSLDSSVRTAQQPEYLK
ncbi:MAG: hypothetical protein Q8Q08_10155 [Candidatus Omnitrophota bacterium]|nr:hypothetical protein [Candidatus Omnitrophota bacterium]MDZ4242204.1 hypothetical protein [Candidatus Omnitrophota bacterium]